MSVVTKIFTANTEPPCRFLATSVWWLSRHFWLSAGNCPNSGGHGESLASAVWVTLTFSLFWVYSVTIYIVFIVGHRLSEWGAVLSFSWLFTLQIITQGIKMNGKKLHFISFLFHPDVLLIQIDITRYCFHFLSTV